MYHDHAAPSGTLEIKEGGNDPAAAVTAALDAFRSEVVGRIEKLEAGVKGDGAPETKGFDKMNDRLDKIEAKMNRPAGGERKDKPSAELKAFGAEHRAFGSGPESFKLCEGRSKVRLRAELKV